MDGVRKFSPEGLIIDPSAMQPTWWKFQIDAKISWVRLLCQCPSEEGRQTMVSKHFWAHVSLTWAVHIADNFSLRVYKSTRLSDNIKLKAKNTQLWTLGIGTPQPCLTLSKDSDVSFTSLSLSFISFTQKVTCVIVSNTSTWRTNAYKQTLYSNHYTKRGSKTRKL